MVRKTLLAAAAAALVAPSLRAGDPTSTVFATPLPPGPGNATVPGSTLNAPVINYAGTKHGRSIFDFTPAGTDSETITTKDPARYLSGQGSCIYPPEQIGWFSAEYLYWATQGPAIPPLVTSGPASLGAGLAGIVGQPNTQDLLGGQRGLNGLRPGVRLTLGAFIDDNHDWALSHQIISLGSRSERLVGGSDGTNVVNLPQFAAVGGQPVQTPLYVGFPGLSSGTVTASAQTSFFSGDTHLRRVFQANGIRLDLLAGYRFLTVGDSIADSFDIVSNAPTSPRLMGNDSVRTRNYFHGGEVGFNAQGRTGQFTYEMQATIALGVTASDLDQQQTRSTFVGGAGGPVIQTAGHNQTDYFSVVPQVGFKLGWQPWQHVRFTAGYDFLYWSKVRRAEELYGPGPVLRDTTTDFWAQGFSIGAEVRY
ncbi:MAG TPA: BBP7 family outer membrane beta-barrel protein [Urbifossiella sp.]|nr:BBP7 family outer membrane beta-barrel protein [Urbifossiella sp.]